MAKKKIINDFTTGPIMKSLIVFSVPFMLSNALQVAYSLVDMIVVGQVVGSYGLSAVNVASQVFTFVTMVALGFCSGGQVYISQLIGAKHENRLNATIGTLFTFIISFSLIMSAFCLLFRNQVLHLLDTPVEAYDMALDYLLVCGSGVIFTYGYNLVSAILRGMGDSKHPFVFISIASVMNLVLDILFVKYLNMSVFGAALATILGQAFSFIASIIYLYHNKEMFHFDFKLESFKMDMPIFSNLCKLGIPFAIQSAAINISMLYVNKLVNGIGVYASATFGVGIKLDDIVNKITQGISVAVSAMVGQNFAAKKHDRVVKTAINAWIFGAGFYMIFTIAYFMFNKQMFGWFTEDQEVIELAPTFVKAIVVSFPAMVLMRGTNGFIQGIGNAKMSLVFALLDGFVFRIGLSYLFGIVMGMGFYGFILGFALAPYGTGVPCAIYMFSGKWKKFKLITDR